MNRHIAQLLKANAEKLVPAAHFHEMYRQLKREWVSTPHREKSRLRKLLEEGKKLFLHPDNTVPASRAAHKARDEKRAARKRAKKRRRTLSAPEIKRYHLKGFTFEEAVDALKKRGFVIGDDGSFFKPELGEPFDVEEKN